MTRWLAIALLGFCGAGATGPVVSTPNGASGQKGPAPVAAAIAQVAPTTTLGPQVQVPADKLAAFRIDQDEVTNGEYAACVKAGACTRPAFRGEDDVPVRGVTWNDAAAYCKFRGLRLPTDAEWERVTTPPGSDGAGPVISPKYDLCRVLIIGGSYGQKCRIRRTEPNRVTRLDGLEDSERFDRIATGAGGDDFVYDLFGNVAEWVADDVEPPQKPDRPVKSAAMRKLIRGGSFASTDILERRSALPTERMKDVGCRCAADVK